MPASSRVKKSDRLPIKDFIFAELALRDGKTSHEVILKGQKVLKEMETFGINRSLSSILVERKLMEREREKEVLDAMAGIQVPCGYCRHQNSLDLMGPDGRLRCGRCRGLLSIQLEGIERGRGAALGSGFEEHLKCVLLGGPKNDSVDSKGTAASAQRALNLGRPASQEVTAEKLRNSQGPGMPRLEEVKAIRPRINARNSIKRYIIEKTLSSGPFGRLYRAQHQSGEGPKMALKVITPGRLADLKLVSVFKKKLDIWNRLEGKDRGKYSLEIEDSIYYIVRPYLGSPLASLSSIKLEELTNREELIYDITTQLMRIHAAGLVHGNLKPSNVFFNLKDPEIILLVDPFLHHLVPREDKLTRWRFLADSPRFCPPEVIDGGEPAASSDVYSLGWIFYTILAGAIPFAGVPPPEVLRRHREGPCPDLPADLGPWRMLHSAMTALDPKERPASAAEVLERVEEIRIGKKPGLAPVTIRSTPSLVAESRLKKKQRPVVFRYLLGPALLLALLVWVGFGVSNWLGTCRAFSTRDRVQVLLEDLSEKEYWRTNKKAKESPQNGRELWKGFLRSFGTTPMRARAEAEMGNYP